MKKRMLGYSTKEFEKILVNNGFKFHRQGKGDHLLYSHPEKGKIVIPTRNKEICRCITVKLIKRYQLQV